MKNTKNFKEIKDFAIICFDNKYNLSKFKKELVKKFKNIPEFEFDEIIIAYKYFYDRDILHLL